jgi:hypothetical protein
LRHEPLQGLAPVHPAGREGVEHRQGEEDSPGEGCQPPPGIPARGRRASADDVVAVVDRLQERVEVGDRPFLEGRRHQDDRLRTAGQALLERLVPADRVGPDDERFGLAVPAFEQVEQASADRVGVGMSEAGHHDDQDSAVGDRVAAGSEVERVDPVVSGFQRVRFREGPHARVARGASQASSAL